MTGEDTEAKPKSNLKTSRERFLALVIEHALEVGRRTPEDFVRHFPPRVIMEGLSDRPSLRAKILVPTVGTKQRVALKKSWESAADDLDISLQEGETQAQAVVELLDPDDRVTYLDDKALWQFIIEGDFWRVSRRGEEGRVAQQHVAYMLSTALEENLINHEAVVGGITVAELSTRLTKEALGRIIEGALLRGKGGAAFTEVDLLRSLPPEEIVKFVPLSHIWENVIRPQVAVAHGYEEAPAVEEESDGDAEEEEEDEELKSALRTLDEADPKTAGNGAQPAKEVDDEMRWTSTPPSNVSADDVSALDEDDLTDADFDDEIVEAS